MELIFSSHETGKFPTETFRFAVVLTLKWLNRSGKKLAPMDKNQ